MSSTDSPSSRARVLLADDHEEFLAFERRLLEPEFEVLDVVHDGQAAIAAAVGLEPDALVLDISMPVTGGIDAARLLREAGARTRIVVLTVHGDPDYVRAALAVGALGYVHKCRLASDLVPALRDALAGRTFVSPTIHMGPAESRVP